MAARCPAVWNRQFDSVPQVHEGTLHAAKGDPILGKGKQTL